MWGILGVLLGAAVAGIRTAAFCCCFPSMRTRCLAAATHPGQPAHPAAASVPVERPRGSSALAARAAEAVAPTGPPIGTAEQKKQKDGGVGACLLGGVALRAPPRPRLSLGCLRVLLRGRQKKVVAHQVIRW